MSNRRPALREAQQTFERALSSRAEQPTDDYVSSPGDRTALDPLLNERTCASSRRLTVSRLQPTKPRASLAAQTQLPLCLVRTPCRTAPVRLKRILDLAPTAGMAVL